MKNEPSTAGNYLVPTSGHAIARRSASLVKRGLRDLDATEQNLQCSQDIFQELDNLWLDYSCGEAYGDSRLWKDGDPFSYFTGSSLPDVEGEPVFFVFEFFLVGNDDLAFWNEIGDPAGLTQEKLRSALRKYRSKLHQVAQGGIPDFLGELHVITPPFESR